MGKGSGGSGRSSNDQKSDAHNPTSQEHKDNMDNHSRQLNPEDWVYDSSRGQLDDDDDDDV